MKYSLRKVCINIRAFVIMLNLTTTHEFYPILSLKQTVKVTTVLLLAHTGSPDESQYEDREPLALTTIPQSF